MPRQPVSTLPPARLSTSTAGRCLTTWELAWPRRGQPWHRYHRVRHTWGRESRNCGTGAHRRLLDVGFL